MYGGDFSKISSVIEGKSEKQVVYFAERMKRKLEDDPYLERTVQFSIQEDNHGQERVGKKKFSEPAP